MREESSEAWYTCAVPWKPPWMLEGMPTATRACSIAVVASLRETPGVRL